MSFFYYFYSTILCCLPLKQRDVTHGILTKNRYYNKHFFQIWIPEELYENTKTCRKIDVGRPLLHVYGIAAFPLFCGRVEYVVVATFSSITLSERRCAYNTFGFCPTTFETIGAGNLKIQSRSF